MSPHCSEAPQQLLGSTFGVRNSLPALSTSFSTIASQDQVLARYLQLKLFDPTLINCWQIYTLSYLKVTTMIMPMTVNNSGHKTCNAFQLMLALVHKGQVLCSLRSLFRAFPHSRLLRHV